MRIVFFGTPSFAIPTLDALAREHEIVLVVAQPDRPAGRGMKMQRPAVVARAEELGLAIAQPQKIRTDEFLASIASLAPEVGIVIAYGRILPGPLLSIPANGFLNVHGSLLPKYRGAAPIQRAIAAGESETGVTIMRVDEELDHGPMLAIETTEIGPDERLSAVSERLADLGADAMLRVLRNLARGAAIDRQQDHGRATHAAKIEKSEGLVTFEESAAEIYNRFRAFDPWPGLFIQSDGETIKIPEMRTASGGGVPRTILEIGDGVVVAAREGALRLIELQRAGKPRAAAADVARGLGWRAGARIP